MTAAALLVVLGAALLMQAAGMSMALGAFLAGVLLAESNYRHELEADIEPFRGLLLALFFMGVGMSIDMTWCGRISVLIVAAAVVDHGAQGRRSSAVLFRATCPTPRRRAARRLGAHRRRRVRLRAVSARRARSACSARAQGSLFAAIAAVTHAARAAGRGAHRRGAAPPCRGERARGRRFRRRARRRCCSSASAASARSCRNACSPKAST